jgi:hypothetical protein
MNQRVVAKRVERFRVTGGCNDARGAQQLAGLAVFEDEQVKLLARKIHFRTKRVFRQRDARFERTAVMRQRVQHGLSRARHVFERIEIGEAAGAYEEHRRSSG